MSHKDGIVKSPKSQKIVKKTPWTSGIQPKSKNSHFSEIIPLTPNPNYRNILFTQRKIIGIIPPTLSPPKVRNSLTGYFNMSEMSSSTSS